VTARGNERKTIFRDDRDRQHFLQVIRKMVLRFRVRLHCFVLMDNHYHLLLELTDTNLSRAVQWLNVSFSVWFNRRHQRSGHLFQGRFESLAVSRGEWALELSCYVHLNPTRIQALGLSRTDRQGQRVGLSPAPNADEVRRRVAILRQDRWSSYRAYIGPEWAPEWLQCQTVLGWAEEPKVEGERTGRSGGTAKLRRGGDECQTIRTAIGT
jgi:putative transposase